MKEVFIDFLVFKVKLVSEVFNLLMVSVKSDEFFKEWDCVLCSFLNVILEF